MTEPETPAGELAPTMPETLSGRLSLYRRRGIMFALAAIAGGVALGVVWRLAVHLPSYRVGEDLFASTTERDLAQWVSSDAWFTVLAALGGLVLGTVAWFRLRNLGWLTPVLTVATAMLAALAMWQTGLLLAPDSFAHRVAVAKPGDLVEIDFALRSLSALFMWPFAAVTPVMLAAAFAPESSHDIAAAERAWQRRHARLEARAVARQATLTDTDEDAPQR